MACHAHNIHKLPMHTTESHVRKKNQTGVAAAYPQTPLHA